VAIGTWQRPRNGSQAEVKLTRPLVSGESISLYQRLIFDTTSTGWTLIGTFDTVGQWSFSKAVNFSNAQWLQLQAVMTSTGTNPSFVRLREVRFTELNG